MSGKSDGPSEIDQRASMLKDDFSQMIDRLVTNYKVTEATGLKRGDRSITPLHREPRRRKPSREDTFVFPETPEVKENGSHPDDRPIRPAGNQRAPSEPPKQEPTRMRPQEEVESLFKRLLTNPQIHTRGQQPPADDNTSSITAAVDGAVARSTKLEVACEIKTDNIESIRGIEFSSNGKILIAGDVSDALVPVIEVYTAWGVKVRNIPHDVPEPGDIRLRGNEIFMACRRSGCVKTINTEGTLLNVIQYPYRAEADIRGIEVDDGHIYSTDWTDGGKVHKCPLSSGIALEWSKSQKGFYYPSHICAMRNGNMAVYASGDVIVFNNSGQQLHKYTDMEYLSGSTVKMCIDEKNRLLVPSFRKDKIIILSERCEFLGEFLNQQQFGIKGPRLLAISPGGGHLAIAHSSNKVLVLCTK